MLQSVRLQGVRHDLMTEQQVMIPSELSFPWNACSQSFESTATKHSVDTSVFLCPNFIQQETRLVFVSPDWSSYQERKYWLCRLSEPIPTVVISLCTWSSCHLVYTLVLKCGEWDDTTLSVLRKPGFHVCNDLSAITQSSLCHRNLLWRHLPILSSGGGTTSVWEKTSGITTEVRLNGGWVAICHAPGPPEYTETLATSGLWGCLTAQPRFCDSILL